MPSPFAQPLSSCVPDCEPAPGFEKLRTIVTGERKICQAFSGSASPLMRPTEIEGGSSTQVEVRYFRPVDSLCCRRGILALEFHNLVARLHACLTSLTPSHCSQRKAGGGSDHVRNSFVRNFSGCDGPRVPMVEPTHPRQSYKRAMTRFPSLYRPRLGRVLPQSIVDPIRMIQVISTTPILGSVEKSAIRGIRGTAVKCGCMQRS